MALKYSIQLPAPGAADVAIRELSVTKGSDPTTLVELAGNATEYQLLVERDMAVALQLVDIDSSGNRSQPGPVLAFIATDDIPPPAPGGMAVTNVEEVDAPGKRKS